MENSSEIFVLGPRESFTPKVGLLVSMLANARYYLQTVTRDLTIENLDSRPDNAPNSIGALLAHLTAAETLFQCMTFENRQFNEEETAYWIDVFKLRACDRNQGRSLDSYMQELDEIRKKTLVGMRERDDTWLESPKDIFGHAGNIHYYWFHYLQDEVRHTGQITMMRKHMIENNDPKFNAYNFQK